MKKTKRRVIIMGAAGKDFHVFNTLFRNKPEFEVVAFTATQIPGIAGRKYPAVLAGKLYPRGIPIFPEEKLAALIKRFKASVVVFAYSDVTYDYVLERAAIAVAGGADFYLPGTEVMLEPRKPVVAITAVRTGCGKSPVTRQVCELLRKRGKRVVVVRHPMPYGDLAKQAVQRFACLADLDKHKCTIEEREEYEPLIRQGVTLFAGVDYERILRAAEREADVIVWDGGNNDVPFFKPKVWVVIADGLRPGHEFAYYPGRVNLTCADIVLINKKHTAKPAALRAIGRNAMKYNKNGKKASVFVVDADVIVDSPLDLRGKRVLVIEDGPTITHGGMPFGAGFFAAKRAGAKPVDARRFAVGSLKRVFKQYAHIGRVLPAMGYSPQQLRELEETINKTPCDVVMVATPADLRRVLHVRKPVARVRYEMKKSPQFERALVELLLRKV